MLNQIATRGVQYEISCPIQLHALRTFKLHPNDTGINARRDLEVIFELLLVPVVDEVNTWVKILIDDSTVVGDVGMPLGWIVTDEVVARSALLVCARHFRVWTGAD